MARSCATCHNGANPLPNVQQYAVAYQLRAAIVRKVTGREMPKYGRISESDRDLLKLWVQSGAKP
ncbi:MAG: hypothetical protein IPM52_14505 [Bacteroidetes bacterium]|nr:hypothetical protein [Bacteroidota bacterium]